MVPKVKNRVPRCQAHSVLDLQADLVKLDARVSNLEKHQDKLETKQIDEWKVVKIVFVVFGGIGVVVGIIFAIINYVT